MELKLISASNMFHSVIALLIEPVWNWNSHRGSYQSHHHQTFNRTSMELKLTLFPYNRTVRAPFNRTSMELKPPRHGAFFCCGAAFNRTSMELKLCSRVKSELKIFSLLIEPVWNWNVNRVQSTVCTGLELLIEPVWNWNEVVGMQNSYVRFVF